jgi:RNA polymerase sigma factor (sigma-70 family)
MNIDKEIDRIISQYEKMITQSAKKYIKGTNHAIEDAIVDCYWHLYSKIKYIKKHVQNEEHYVHTLIKNFFIDMWRNQNKEKLATYQHLISLEESNLEVNEFNLLIQDLNKEEKELMTMFHLYKFSNLIIAEHLNITQDALRKRIERVHKKLRKSMSKEMEDNL